MALQKITFLTLLAFVIIPIQAQSVALSDYRWTSIETTGSVKERHEDAFIEYKDKFYLMGGRGINPVNVYDPASSSWETKLGAGR